MKDVIVIGIAGGTGSGKSTLIQKIKDEFSNEDHHAEPRFLLQAAQ